jgi:hypothetical protein
VDDGVKLVPWMETGVPATPLIGRMPVKVGVDVDVGK